MTKSSSMSCIKQQIRWGG